MQWNCSSLSLAAGVLSKSNRETNIKEISCAGELRPHRVGKLEGWDGAERAPSLARDLHSQRETSDRAAFSHQRWPRTRDCGSRTGKRSPHLQTSSSPRFPRHRSPNLHPAERHFPGRSPPQRAAAAAAAPERLITSIPRGRQQPSQCSASAVTRVTARRLDSRPAAWASPAFGLDPGKGPEGGAPPTVTAPCRRPPMRASAAL